MWLVLPYYREISRNIFIRKQSFTFIDLLGEIMFIPGLCAISFRKHNIKDIVLTGNLTSLELCKTKFCQFNKMYEKEGLRFIIPELSAYATVIGTALS